MSVAPCPACGAQIEFTIGSSIVVVCEYCRSLVARTDRDLKDLGKVAALVETPTVLQRGVPGKYRGVGFRIVGRTQMRHEQGGIWNEWYAAFDDLRWGWLAEAQGKYYVTFLTSAKKLLPRDSIAVGQKTDGMVITEIGRATLVSAEGEIPWQAEPDSVYAYADLSGAQKQFGTLDFSEDPPLFFKGEETTLRELGISIEQTGKSKRVAVAKLSCPKCGAALDLVAPDQAERVICPSCNAMHDVTDGKLEFLQSLKQKGPRPKIKLGSRGKIEGVEYAVAGFVARSVTFDRKYYWTEYLIFNPNEGFKWLVDSDDHWSLATPLNAGDVDDPEPTGVASRVSHDGKTFKVFQDATATVESVLGEFYWKVVAGEKVRAIDWIAPPLGITKEIANKAEVNYTLARYVPADEVKTAFALKKLPRPAKVGMIQPNPATPIVDLWSKLMIGLFVLALIIGVTRSRREVLNEQFAFGHTEIESLVDAPPQPPQWSETDTKGRVFFTKPIQLAGGRNLEVEGFSAAADNAWLYVGCDLIDEKGAVVDSFELPIEHYQGVDGGESWSEGSKTRSAYLPAVAKGNYTMRVEGQWDTRITDPKVLITMKEGVFRWSHLILAFLGITIPAVFFGVRPLVFESQRWQESMYTQFGTVRSEGGGDDEE